MAFASWLNISVANGRSAVVYRAWDAVNRLLAGDMAAKWTIRDSSEGATPAWVGDTSPAAEGGFVVLQCETPNADASKMQVFIGCRAASGALAGFGTKAAGLWMCVSPTGGWTTYVPSPLAGGFFGASSADWRNGSIKVVTSFTGATVMGLILSSGDTNRPGGVWVHVRNGSGSADVLAGRMLVPPSASSPASSRCALTAASPWLAGNHALILTGATVAAKTSMDGWDNCTMAVPDVANVYSSPCFGSDAESGAPVETVVPCFDTIIAKFRGYDEMVLRLASADGDLNGAIGSATRWVYGGFSWPREPARDGSWV